MVGIALVYPEALYGYGASQALSFAHVRKPTAVANPPDVYESRLENIRGGHDALSFRDLGKKPQTPLLEFFIEACLRKNLYPVKLALGDSVCDLLTRSRKSTSIWASPPRKLLATSTLDRELKRDWVCVRYSFGVVSVV